MWWGALQGPSNSHNLSTKKDCLRHLVAEETEVRTGYTTRPRSHGCGARAGMRVQPTDTEAPCRQPSHHLLLKTKPKQYIHKTFKSDLGAGNRTDSRCVCGRCEAHAQLLGAWGCLCLPSGEAAPHDCQNPARTRIRQAASTAGARKHPGSAHLRTLASQVLKN